MLTLVMLNISIIDDLIMLICITINAHFSLKALIQYNFGFKYRGKHLSHFKDQNH